MVRHVAAAPERPVVLVVEDEPLIAMELETSLRDAGYGVVGVAATEWDAIDLASRGGFHCALLDIQLRDGTSAALARKLKAQRVPFVVTTGLRPQDVTDAHLRSAPTLRKPFEMHELLEHIERLVRERFGKAAPVEPASPPGE